MNKNEIFIIPRMWKITKHDSAETYFSNAIKHELAAAYQIPIDVFNDCNRSGIDTPALSLNKCSNSDFVFYTSEDCQDHDLMNFLSLPRSPRWVIEQWINQHRRNHFGQPYSIHTCTWGRV